MDLSKIRILVLDNDAANAQSIYKILQTAGYQMSLALNEEDAIALTEQKIFNLIIRGFDADRMNARAFMVKIKTLSPDTQFVLVGKGGNIRLAVDSIHHGAFDYLSKPVNPAQLAESVKKALEHQSIVAEDQQIRLRLHRQSDPNIFVGVSAGMESINRLIREIAPTDVTVLIQGESGTGKEIVARAIHEKSRRSGGPFTAVNCAALPDSLIESELFGHVKGAFTGAVADRLGRFQLSQGGTLFLDEISDLSAKGQGDLLRVLEDGMFRPIGSPKMLRTNTRLIAATNRNLEEACVAGRFREDLFYRVNIVHIGLPPLRERAEDIPLLVETFIRHFCAKHQRRVKKVGKEVIGLLQSLAWPGNVRQLRNLVERLVVTVPAHTIEVGHLAPVITAGRNLKKGFVIQPGMTLAQVEAELIRQTLLKVTSHRQDAAQALGISRRALQYKIRRYGLNL